MSALLEAIPLLSSLFVVSNFARKSRYFVTSPRTRRDQPVKAPFTGMQRRRELDAETHCIAAAFDTRAAHAAATLSHGELSVHVRADPLAIRIERGGRELL